MPDEFTTMRAIGQLFGETSHTVGKKLKECGLRMPDGKPSCQAHTLGLVDRKFTEDHRHYIWVWHLAKTVALLEKAGGEMG